ncbi:hypothetical protein M404DRAFT_546541 [Pisolithus tinctorius Marx 270]|uniref:Uncharacterized protein n=1 Tax=Pisolithus tinctorius Marx 270 TaxID=870435 RepID=A0A0C3PA06_PISTI|nr:hypothetical protein M404DRAFT_546541 [Pisolithus tinctorius Marx 270]
MSTYGSACTSQSHLDYSILPIRYLRTPNLQDPSQCRPLHQQWQIGHRRAVPQRYHIEDRRSVQLVCTLLYDLPSISSITLQSEHIPLPTQGTLVVRNKASRRAIFVIARSKVSKYGPHRKLDADLILLPHGVHDKHRFRYDDPGFWIRDPWHSIQLLTGFCRSPPF